MLMLSGIQREIELSQYSVLLAHVLLRIFGKAQVQWMLCSNFWMVKLVMNKERNKKNQNPQAHVSQKERAMYTFVSSSYYLEAR